MWLDFQLCATYAKLAMVAEQTLSLRHFQLQIFSLKLYQDFDQEKKNAENFDPSWYAFLLEFFS